MANSCKPYWASGGEIAGQASFVWVGEGAPRLTCLAVNALFSTGLVEPSVSCGGTNTGGGRVGKCCVCACSSVSTHAFSFFWRAAPVEAFILLLSIAVFLLSHAAAHLWIY